MADAPTTETAADEKYFAKNPKVKALVMVLKFSLMPAAMAGGGTWMNSRVTDTKAKTEAGYSSLAPAVKDLQEQVKVLTAQAQVYNQLLAVLMGPKANPVPRPVRRTFSSGHGGIVAAPAAPPTPSVVPAATPEAMKNINRPVRAFLQRRLPANLEEAVHPAAPNAPYVAPSDAAK